MRILTRYLLRTHLGPFLFSLSVLTGVLFVNTVAKRIERELAGKGVETSVIVELFALSLPHIIALTLPMAVLVAVLYAFSSLAADHEVTALKASGINLGRLLVPLVAIAALLAAAMLVFNDRILPETNHRLAVLVSDIQRKSPTLSLKEQVVNEIRAGDHGQSTYFLRASRIEPGTNRLWDVVIYDLSMPSRRRTIYADSGRMAFNRQLTDLFLTLHDGVVLEASPNEPEEFRTVGFSTQLVRIPDVGRQLERSITGQYRSDREMSLAMLQERVEASRAEVADVRRQAAEQARAAVAAALEGREAVWSGPGADAMPMVPGGATRLAGGELLGRAQARSAERQDALVRRTAVQLRQLESTASALEQRANQYRVEYHKKFAIPFACIVFVLIGAPLAVRFPRGGVGMVIAVSLVIFGVYYLGLTGGEYFADRGYIHPMLAMWVSNVIFLALGLWGVARIGHEAASTRGGGWDDLLSSARAALRHPMHTLRARRAA